MPAFLLGVVALCLLLWAASAFIRADPKEVARVLRWIGGIAALLLAGFLLFRGHGSDRDSPRLRRWQAARSDVRFRSKADIHPPSAESALPPKADMVQVQCERATARCAVSPCQRQKSRCGM
jgi:hypothetical protein